jgi:hypothetical protein
VAVNRTEFLPSRCGLYIQGLGWSVLTLWMLKGQIASLHSILPMEPEINLLMSSRMVLGILPAAGLDWQGEVLNSSYIVSRFR